MIAGVGPLGIMVGGRERGTRNWTVITFFWPNQCRHRTGRTVRPSHIMAYVGMHNVGDRGMVHAIQADSRQEALRLAQRERAALENARLEIEAERERP